MFDEIFKNLSVETVIYYVLALGIYTTLFVWLSRRMTTSRTEMRRDARQLLSENLALMEAMKRVRGEMENDEQRGELDQMWRRLLRETSGRIEELNNDEERILADPSEQYLLLPPPVTAFGAILSLIFVAAVFFAGAVFLFLIVNVANAELDPVVRAEDLRYGLQIAGVGLAAIGLAFLSRFAAYQSFKARMRKLRSEVFSDVLQEKVAEKKKKSRRERSKKPVEPEGSSGEDAKTTPEPAESGKSTRRSGGLGKLKLRKAAETAKAEPIAEIPSTEPPIDSGEGVRRVPREERGGAPQEPGFGEPPLSAPRSGAPQTQSPPPQPAAPQTRAAEPDPGPAQPARFRQPAGQAQPAQRPAAPAAGQGVPATPRGGAGSSGLIGGQSPGAPQSGAPVQRPQADPRASVPSTQRPSVDPGWQQVLGQPQSPAGGQPAQTPPRRPLRDPNAPDDEGKA